MEYSAAGLKNKVVLQKSACTVVYDKGFSEKQKQKEQGVQFHQDGDKNNNNNNNWEPCCYKYLGAG